MGVLTFQAAGVTPGKYTEWSLRDFGTLKPEHYSKSALNRRTQ